MVCKEIDTLNKCYQSRKVEESTAEDVVLAVALFETGLTEFEYMIGEAAWPQGPHQSFTRIQSILVRTTRQPTPRSPPLTPMLSEIYRACSDCRSP